MKLPDTTPIQDETTVKKSHKLRRRILLWALLIISLLTLIGIAVYVMTQDSNPASNTRDTASQEPLPESPVFNFGDKN